MVTRCCGKRVRIDSIAARLLRRHIEAIVLPRAFHGTVNGAMRLTRQKKRPGHCPGLRKNNFSSVAAAAAAARAAAIGALIGEVPSAVLRIERVFVRGLRGQNGGEGEQCGESNK